MSFADARPDRARSSNDSRMEKAVTASLRQILPAVYPRALITQGENREDSFFWNGVTKWAQDTSISHIALPTYARNIMWISALDSTALGGKPPNRL